MVEEANNDLVAFLEEINNDLGEEVEDAVEGEVTAKKANDNFASFWRGI